MVLSLNRREENTGVTANKSEILVVGRLKGVPIWLTIFSVEYQMNLVRMKEEGMCKI